MIKNIIFDFGKVLVDYDMDVVIDSFFTDMDECRRFKDILCGAEFTDICDRGEKPFLDIIADVRAEHPEWEEPLRLFVERFQEFIFAEIPGMRDVLTRLRAEGFALYGLTNWSQTVYEVIDRFPILRMLDGRVISSEEQIIKPDVRIYECLCNRFGLKAEECVFTDDKPVNIEGARRAGMQGIVFHNAGQFEQELRLLLSSN